MFRIRATANRGADARTGTITVTAPGAPTRIINVTQTSAKRTLMLSRRNWDPDSPVSNVEINVTSGRRWNVRSSVNWLTISNINPETQTGNGSFIISATANRRMTARTGRITVTALGGAQIQTIFVTQSPAGGILTSSKSHWNPDSPAGNVAINETSSSRWLVRSRVKF